MSDANTLPLISKQTARRLVLGRQGLWPGRRYAGKQGVAEAIRASECVQVDTISTIARSHDLMLWSRVADYDPHWLNELCYRDRLFFDFGTILMIYPARHLIHFQAIMQRFRQRLENVSPEAQAARQHVLDEIARRGPLASRDFADRTRIPGGFNMVKDTSSALYHLYLGGQVMTHSRRNFERVYDLTPNVLGSHDDEGLPDGGTTGIPDETRDAEFFALKAMRDLGLASGPQWARRVAVMQHDRPAARYMPAFLSDLVTRRLLTRVRVEGSKETYYLPIEDYGLLDTLARGEVPDAWQPPAWIPEPTTTHEEVNFLAPLDNVIWDRARLKELFDFDYVWEVYKPAHTRRWGYYTLPILYRDRLVGRIAPRLDRKTHTLHIEGFWLEEGQAEAAQENSEPKGSEPEELEPEGLKTGAGRDEQEAFRCALSAGLRRFARFHEAVRLETSALANQNNAHRVLLDNIAAHYTAAS